MYLHELLEQLKNDTKLNNNKKLTSTKLAEILNVTKSTISKRVAKRDSEVTVSELQKIEKALGVSLFTDENNGKFSKIERYNACGSCGPGYDITQIEPEIGYLMLDNNLIYKILRTKPENLYIIQAKGDSMIDAGIYEDDVLLIDKSKRDSYENGIYLFTTDHNEHIFIKRLRYRPGEILEVISANSSYETLYYTKQDLINLEFSIKGRVIKNLSRGL